jgi:hypothetical protein
MIMSPSSGLTAENGLLIMGGGASEGRRGGR